MNPSGPAKKNSPLTWGESQQPAHPECRERVQKANWCLPEPFFTCLGRQKTRLARLQTVYRLGKSQPPPPPPPQFSRHALYFLRSRLKDSEF